MIIAAGVFLVVNGALDINIAVRSRGAIDLTIALAGIALGILVLCGVGL